MTPYPPIAQLLPHAAPMILLDRLVAHDSTHAVCEVTVREGMPFVQDHRVATLVSLEYMAQTVAAFAGYNGYLKGGEAPMGFLIGCRQMRSHLPYIAAGTTLTIKARHIWGDTTLGTFECTAALADGTLVAATTLNVLQPEPTHALDGPESAPE